MEHSTKQDGRVPIAERMSVNGRQKSDKLIGVENEAILFVPLHHSDRHTRNPWTGHPIERRGAARYSRQITAHWLGHRQGIGLDSNTR